MQPDNEKNKEEKKKKKKDEKKETTITLFPDTVTVRVGTQVKQK